MIRLSRNLLVSALITWACFLPPASAAGTSGEQPRVVLRSNVTVSAQAVCLGNIADITAEDGAIHERIASLDLVDLPLSGPPTIISKSQVSFRMQLAGMDSSQVRLEGADFIHVSLAPQERLEGRIEAAARQALLEKIGGKASELAIQLSQRITVPAMKESPGEIQLEAEAPARPSIPGPVYVNVSIYVRSAHRLTVTVCFDVKIMEAVVVALRGIAAGEALTDTNTRAERIPVDHPGKAALPAELLGRRARRVLPAGQAITADDVEAASSASPILIHQHDMVSLVVRSGALQVTARGQAMEDGRADQAIRVRNVDSNTIVTGRVVDRSVVEVDLLRAQP